MTATAIPAVSGTTPETKIRRPVLRCYGGKWRLGSRLVQLFPPHHIYTEAFGGAASVLMQKPRAANEIYNDLDGDLVNVFRVLQCHAKAKRLAELLRVTPFARAEFEKSYRPAKDPVEAARRTIIRSFQGFGSDSVTRVKASRVGFNSSLMKTGFRYNNTRANVSAAEDWSHYPAQVAAFCERLQGVTIERRNALELLAKCDRPDALHYVDPPYPKEVRNNGASESRVEHNYRHEMSTTEHEALAELLHSLKGMVVISSYPGTLYRRLYSGWPVYSWTGSQFCHNAQKRTEMVWLNPAAEIARSQQSLFER
jgi:DNA adenine methylase